jgi:hypothetical protein
MCGIEPFRVGAGERNSGVKGGLRQSAIRLALVVDASRNQPQLEKTAWSENDSSYFSVRLPA